MVLKYKCSENVVCRELGGQKILIPIQQHGVDLQSIYALNTTAEAVWKLLDNEKTLEDILANLTGEYTAPTALIRKDVVKLLDEMIAENVVISL